MTIVSINQATGAFATGIACDDYAYQYSKSFTPAAGHGPPCYTFFHSGYGSTTGINWVVQVTNDINEDHWLNYASGTLVTLSGASCAISGNYALSRAGMRIDVSGNTATSGFAWVAP